MTTLVSRGLNLLALLTLLMGLIGGCFMQSAEAKEKLGNNELVGNTNSNNVSMKNGTEDSQENFKLELEPDGTSRFGPASMIDYRGLRIFNLFGSRKEQAYQQGRLVRDFLESTALPYYAKRIGNAIEESPIGRGNAFWEWLTRLYVNHSVYPSFRKQLSREDREVSAAFARGAGANLNEVLNVLVLRRHCCCCFSSCRMSRN